MASSPQLRIAAWLRSVDFDLHHNPIGWSSHPKSLVNSIDATAGARTPRPWAGAELWIGGCCGGHWRCTRYVSKSVSRLAGRRRDQADLAHHAGPIHSSTAPNIHWSMPPTRRSCSASQEARTYREVTRPPASSSAVGGLIHKLTNTL